MKAFLSKSKIVVFLALCCTFVAVKSSEISPVPHKNISQTMKNVPSDETEGFLHVRQIYTNLEKKLKSIVSNTIKRSLPTIMREVYSRNLSSVCLSSLLQLTGALRQTKLWAFKMLDASGKIPTGFLAGTLTTLGNYEECLGIDIQQPKVSVQGQYCLIEIIPPLPKWRHYMSLHFPVPELRNLSAPDTIIRFITGFVHNFYITTIKTALCTPASCSKDDINKLIQILPEVLDPNWKFVVNRCETKTSFELSFVQSLFMYVFTFIGILIAVATVADLVLEQESTEREDIRGTIFRILRCFSLRMNMITIANYSGPEDKLRFIYGFMFVSVLWILAANVFMYINYDVSANFVDAIKMTTNLFYQMLTSRIFPHQTLFFLGAFVTTYKWMKSQEQNLCVWKYILKAYWRYTPTYMLSIAFLMLTPAWGSGPSWMNYMNPFYDNCKSNWWTNILYINNYVHADKMCLKHSWFFAVAAQLHVIGLLVLILLKRRPKIGLFLNLLLLLGSLFSVFFTNMYYRIPPNEVISFLNNRDRLLYASQTYHQPHYHLISYCSGIYCGYLIATKPKINIAPKLALLFWLLSIAGVLTVLCLVTLWSDGLMPSPIQSASFDALSKLIWAAFIFWMTISLSTERKGICYDVMSWGAFSFFSRLIFVIIIINPSIITMIFSNKKSHLYLTHFEIFYNLGTLLMCSFFAGYIFFICIELPFLQLNQVLKKTCRVKTLNSDINITSNGIFMIEKVTVEKFPQMKIQKGTMGKKPLEKK